MNISTMIEFLMESQILLNISKYVFAIAQNVLAQNLFCDYKRDTL